jgi:hypothetical protein
MPQKKFTINGAKQIQEFESKFYSENNKNTLIVLDRKVVGRHKFTREIVRIELQIANVMFIDFFMDSNQGIEDYIVMLNQQVLMYTDVQIENRLNCGMEEKVQCAVNLTSEITKYKDFIRIMDHICIVRQNRRLAD